MPRSMPYICYGMLEHALLALSMYVYRHAITEYIQHGIGLYTKVHLSLYNIIVRSGMHNIWVWKSTFMYIQTILCIICKLC